MCVELFHRGPRRDVEHVAASSIAGADGHESKLTQLTSHLVQTQSRALQETDSRNVRRNDDVSILRLPLDEIREVKTIERNAEAFEKGLRREDFEVVPVDVGHDVAVDATAYRGNVDGMGHERLDRHRRRLAHFRLLESTREAYGPLASAPVRGRRGDEWPSETAERVESAQTEGFEDSG